MSKDGPEKAVSGWAFPRDNAKAHYFVGGRSLCRRWLWLGPVEEDNGKESPRAEYAEMLPSQRVPRPSC